MGGAAKLHESSRWRDLNATDPDVTLRFCEMRLISVILVLLFMPPLLAAKGRVAPAPVTVLAWESFISSRVITTLKNRENLDIRVIEFTTQKQRDELLAKNRRDIDVIVADTIWVPRYRKLGLLARIDAARVPSLRYMKSLWKTDAEYACHTCGVIPA